jgi:DNA repair exonuclease SbcCD ATPase subunit
VAAAAGVGGTGKGDWMNQATWDAAQARIAELEAELGNEDYETLRMRLEQAEAKVRNAESIMSLQLKQLQQAEAELAALRKQLEVLTDLGYDPELDSITIHRDGIARTKVPSGVWITDDARAEEGE